MRVSAGAFQMQKLAKKVDWDEIKTSVPPKIVIKLRKISQGNDTGVIKWMGQRHLVTPEAADQMLDRMEEDRLS